MSAPNFDYIVVGGGTAGCVLATNSLPIRMSACSCWMRQPRCNRMAIAYEQQIGGEYNNASIQLATAGLDIPMRRSA